MCIRDRIILVAGKPRSWLGLVEEVFPSLQQSQSQKWGEKAVMFWEWNCVRETERVLCGRPAYSLHEWGHTSQVWQPPSQVLPPGQQYCIRFQMLFKKENTNGGNTNSYDMGCGLCNTLTMWPIHSKLMQKSHSTTKHTFSPSMCNDMSRKCSKLSWENKENEDCSRIQESYLNSDSISLFPTGQQTGWQSIYKVIYTTQ